MEENSLVVSGNGYHIAQGILLLLASLGDSPLAVHSAKPRKVYLRELHTLTTRPYVDVVKERARLLDRLLKGLALYGSNESQEDDLFQDLLPEFRRTPICKEYLEWYKFRSPELLQFISTYLVFHKKTQYDDVSLHEVAEANWKATEESMSAFVMPTDSDATALRAIVASLLPEGLVIDPKDLRFGPGHVADIRGANYGIPEKAQGLSKLPWRLRRAIFRDVPHISGLKHLPIDWDGVADGSMSDSAALTSKLVSVFKNVSTSRTICSEENATMLVQQAQFASAKRQFRLGPMGQFVTLDDQTRSQVAAVLGSSSGLVDTIDLKDASDRAHVKLIRDIFPARWSIPLLLTRSSVVLTRQWGPVEVNKFAPMGSALCFPVQCVIFTAICILAYAKQMGLDVIDGGNILCKVRDRCGVRHDALPLTPESFYPPIIFGDDLCVDTRATHEVMALLSKFGFRVNHDKSFTGGQAVREACGIYAHAGEDITPLRYSVPHSATAEMQPSVYASMISLANRAWDFGYLRLRQAVISLLRQRLGEKAKFMPFTADRDAFGVYTEGRITNAVVRVKRGPKAKYDYQRPERKILVVRSVQAEPESLKTYGLETYAAHSRVNGKLEQYLYYRNLASRTSDSAPRHPVIKWMPLEVKNGASRMRPADCRFQWTWAPTG